tara:strand:+ start:50 stop:433 length:384 start_codon:yes stop_codon:yes gene_type:complete
MTTKLSEINNVLLERENECIICMEDMEKGTKLDLSNISYVLRTCNCKANIHKECFNIWYNDNSSCPICSLELIIDDIEANKDNICLDLDYEYWCSSRVLERFICNRLHNEVKIMLIALFLLLIFNIN